MRLTCLGGAGEIGANSYYLRAGGAGLILDPGMHPKKEGLAALPRFAAVDDEVDPILVTHAHLDHVGALPRAMQRFPRARIHMTVAGWRFAQRMLKNAASVMRKKSELDVAGTPPLYGYDALADLSALVETHDFHTPIHLGRGARATFVPAGHIPGAAGILVEEDGKHKTRLFYTGDTCAASQLLIPGAEDPAGPIDVLLTESTYGANLVADGMPADEVLQKFAVSITRVLEGGGIALVPVFALGRAQELLFALWVLAQKGRIPRVPVYLTGLARAVTRVYDDTRHDTPRKDPGLRLERLGFEVLDDQMLASGAPAPPAIILASSGMMLPRTLSNRIARRVLPEPKDTIFIVGYQDPDSPGFRVQKSQPGDAIDLADDGAPVIRNCGVERFHFRAHSTRSELLTTARRLRPALTVLIHGDPTSTDSLAQTLSSAGGKILRPDPAIPYDL